MGQPRRVKPSLVVGMSEGRGLLEGSASSAMYRSDLARFSLSPRAGPSCSTILRAAAKSSGEPHRVPSSRYQALILSSCTSVLILSTIGWRVRAKPRGPRGSPCWTGYDYTIEEYV